MNRVHVTITARRVRIDPEAKRAQYIGRLERLMEELDEIIASYEGDEELRLQAMNVLIRAIKTCYGIIVDVEVEELERLAEEIRAKLEERERAGRDPGYTIEGDEGEPPQA